MEKESIAKHILSLSAKYVAHWGAWQAVRELLQNAIDQHHADAQSGVVFAYSPHIERLTIGTTNAFLTPKTLLLGETDKAEDAGAIGEFGEGYKLAILVLLRLQMDVTIRNGAETWVAKLERSEEYGAHVLTVERFVSGDPSDGVYFDIDGFPKHMFDEVAENYAPGLAIDYILTEEHLRRRVFVGGLFVCLIEELTYGYNFSPKNLRLDRDRMTAKTFDVSCATSRLWDKSGDDEALYASMAEGALDTSYCRVDRPKVQKYFVEQYMCETPDAIPVSTDREAQQLLATGHRVRRVPTALRDLIRRVHTFVFNRAGTPTERLKRFQEQFGHLIYDAEAKAELKSIVESSHAWTTSGELETADAP